MIDHIRTLTAGEGLQARYLILGDRQGGRLPLVYLGGAFQTCENVERTLRQIYAHRQVVIIEMPGFGDTPVVPRTVPTGTIAASVGLVVEHLDIGRFDLIGCSYGGLFALDVAARFPQSVRRIILAGTSPFPAATERGLWLCLNLLEHGENQAFAELFAQLAITLPNAAKRQLLRQRLLTMLADRDESVYERFRENTRRLLLMKSIPPFTDHPTLLLDGEADTFTDPAWMLAQERQFEQVEVELLPGCDHFFHIEDKVATARAIGDYLDRDLTQPVRRLA
ncbi:alpha/beta fold hydrolase [Saccharospirillum mangrovi]|uniref:alpha/beta fold hydrolase n=1 Tax=Saccharospirillum mangrovi TaxID=2161747 RepID=UPI000D3605E6|nr:alpha/beta hydrolase [Saccharospirillum mangrovi]